MTTGGWRKRGLVVASCLLVALLPVATNLATSVVPPSWGWTRNPVVVWAVVLTLALATVLLGVSLTSGRPQEPPSSPDSSGVGDNRGDASPTAVVAAPRTTDPRTAPNESVRPIESLAFEIRNRNAYFAGRERALQDLADSFSARTAGLTSAIITGLGGVGKSELAVEYAHRHRSQYALVWLIHAETTASLLDDLKALARKPSINASPNGLLARIQAWLQAHDDWLLVYDNATRLASIIDYLPRAGRGHILITSQEKGWGSLGKVTSLDVWDRAESVAFLTARLSREPRDGDGAHEVASVLGDLPLALEQAAAFMEVRGTAVYRVRRRI